MKIRKRMLKSGGCSWQLDCGLVNGKRLQVSFRTREAAMVALSKQRTELVKDRLPFEKIATLDKRAADLEQDNMAMAARLEEMAALREKLEAMKERVKVLASYETAVNVPVQLAELRGQVVVHSVPRASGIYFLLQDGVVVYVGQALSVFRRVHDHLAEGLKSFDSVAWFSVPPLRLSFVERLWIKRLKPKYNIQDHPI